MISWNRVADPWQSSMISCCEHSGSPLSTPELSQCIPWALLKLPWRYLIPWIFRLCSPVLQPPVVFFSTDYCCQHSPRIVHQLSPAAFFIVLDTGYHFHHHLHFQLSALNTPVVEAQLEPSFSQLLDLLMGLTNQLSVFTYNLLFPACLSRKNPRVIWISLPVKGWEELPRCKYLS